VFAAGLVLGFIGALLRVPGIATRAAELLEMPVMLVVMAIILALVARDKRRPTISTPAGPAS
jgi:hypothetical protein